MPNLSNYELGGNKKLILVAEILSFGIICLSFLENLLEFFLLEFFLALSFFRNVQKKPGYDQEMCR